MLFSLKLKVLLLIGINLRLNFPLLNSQLRFFFIVNKLILFSTYEDTILNDLPCFDLGSVTSFFFSSCIGRFKFFKLLQCLTGVMLFGTFCFYVLTHKNFSFNWLNCLFLRYIYFMFFVAIDDVGNLNCFELGAINTALEKNFYLYDIIYYSFLYCNTKSLNSNVFSCLHGSSTSIQPMYCNILVPCLNVMEEKLYFLF